MVELELQAYGLGDVALQKAKQEKNKYRQTFTFFDFAEYNQSQGLVLEHQLGKNIDEEELCKVFRERICRLANCLEEAEQRNGFLGKLWHKTKNFTGLGDSSDKVRLLQQKEIGLIKSRKIKEIFNELVGYSYSTENVQKFLKGELKTKSEQALDAYIQGQILACDMMADVLSGISYLGIYSIAVIASPFSSGSSIALGVTLAGASGAAIKSGIKYADAKSADRNYTLNNLKDDVITGGFSGIISPLTGGLGGAIGKGTASKLGVLAIEQVTKTTTNNTVKRILLNPNGYEYIGGNVFSRTLSYGTEFAVDGALSGAIDNGFREAYSGSDINKISQSTLDGFLGGLVFSPIIGGGIKGVGKTSRKSYSNTVNFITKTNKKWVIDFLRKKKFLTVDDVKLLFPSNKLEETSFTKEVDRLIKEIPDERKIQSDYKVIDLKSELNQKDYETIAELINIDKEKYFDVWLGYSETDNIPNLQKLAYFARVMDFTHQHWDFLKFDKTQWNIAVEGIITKPKEYIYPLLRYKYDSSEINIALDKGGTSEEVQSLIDGIRKYLNLFETKEDIVVYRGEGRYGILNASGNPNLAVTVEDFTNGIKDGKYNEEEIEDFALKNFLLIKLLQKRFISTGMTKEAVLPYQKVIAWEEIIVPKGTKGAFIEPFCVERAKEAEFLIMDKMKILIINADYKLHNGEMKWVFKGEIVPE